MNNKLENERLLQSEGCIYIAGIDEAGRGPLAGPVVIASVIMPRDSFIEGVNDSKKVSEKKREALQEGKKEVIEDNKNSKKSNEIKKETKTVNKTNNKTNTKTTNVKKNDDKKPKTESKKTK